MIGYRKPGRQGTHFRRSLDQKREILNVLNKEPAAITRLSNLIELCYADTKRLLTELVEADLICMTTAMAAGLKERQNGRRPMFHERQHVFIITKKGKKCLELMNRSVLVADQIRFKG